MVSKWFTRMEKRHKVRIFKYLDGLSHVKNYRLKVETMMNEMKYHDWFCEDCVNEWNREQENKVLNAIQDKQGAPNFEQGGLF